MDQRAMELLEHGLKDIYDAENRFVDALQTMEKNAHDRSLADGFKRHREVTQNQVKRLEKAFAEIDQPPQKETCKGATGLIQEYESFLAEHRDGDGLLDAFAATAGLKVEHYEIASYRTLIDLAEFCDLDGVSRLLKQNLAEEEQAAAEMMSASAKLAAKLAGASTAKVAGRAVGAAIDRVREGALGNLEGARAVAGTAAQRAASRVTGTRSKARKAASSTKKKAKSTARKTKSRASSTTRRAASSTRKAASSTRRKAKSTASRTRKSATSRARKATSRPKGKTSARRSTTARRRSSR
jgi:ferritin-like metal-binding protein YciE